MTRAIRHLAAVPACALALLGVAGCGSSDEPTGEKLPRSTVAELNQRLDEIQNRYSDGVDDNNTGACQDIQEDSLPAVSKLIDGLPSDTDSKIRDALSNSFQRLQELTQDGCANVDEPQTDTETTETTTVPPETVPPETTETQTAPPETTPTTPTTPDTPTNPGKAKQKNPNQNGGGTSPNDNGGGAEAP